MVIWRYGLLYQQYPLIHRDPYIHIQTIWITPEDISTHQGSSSQRHQRCLSRSDPALWAPGRLEHPLHSPHAGVGGWVFWPWCPGYPKRADELILITSKMLQEASLDPLWTRKTLQRVARIMIMYVLLLISWMTAWCNMQQSGLPSMSLTQVSTL